MPIKYGKTEKRIDRQTKKVSIVHDYMKCKSNKELIGGMNITAKGEIGCWIGRKYWNQGFATETINRLKKFGFEELRLEKIWAATHKENKAPMKVLEKNGFSRVEDRPYYVEGVGETKVRPHFELLNRP